MQNILLANGCYWCTEAVFSQLKGTSNIVSGFYHFSHNDKVECISMDFDDSIIDFIEILQVFFCTHNPTLVKWGESDFEICRSAIVVTNEIYYLQAKSAIECLKQDEIFEEEIQTRVFLYESGSFIAAPEKYQNYYGKQPNAPFCVSNIHPKILKIKKIFAEYIK